MTENERIAKVLGWERKGLSIWWHAPGFDRTITLPDWPNDIGACFRDLVPHVFKRLREADLTWVDAVSMHAGGDGKWNCEFGYPAPDPEEEVEFEYAAAPTLAAAICAAFLAAFEVQQ